MRKVFVMILLLMVCAQAQGVMRFDVPTKNTAASSRFELDGGLMVEFCGIVRDLNVAGDVRECVFSLFMVTAEKDTRLDVKSEAVFDSFGRKFSGPVGVSIAGNGTPSEIIGEVPTLVWFVHRVPVSVRELPKFSRMKFWFNGKEVELRGESVQLWEDWTRTAGVRNEALAVWLEGKPELREMYIAMRNAPDLTRARRRMNLLRAF